MAIVALHQRAVGNLDQRDVAVGDDLEGRGKISVHPPQMRQHFAAAQTQPLCQRHSTVQGTERDVGRVGGIGHDLHGHAGREHRGERHHRVEILGGRQPHLPPHQHRPGRPLVRRPALEQDRHHGAVDDWRSDRIEPDRRAGMEDGAVRKRHDVPRRRDASPDRPHRMHPRQRRAIGSVKAGLDPAFHHCGGRIGQFSLR
ncbi:hypothetical protein ACVIHB_003350 [Bradyrhizobium liaoningense]